MEFVEYVRKNANCEAFYGGKKALILELISNPNKLALSQNSDIYQSVRLFDWSKKTIDLIAVQENEILLVETAFIQTNYSKKRTRYRKRLDNQLLKAYDYLNREFSVSPTLLAAYRTSGSSKIETYCVQRLLENGLPRLNLENEDFFPMGPVEAQFKKRRRKKN